MNQERSGNFIRVMCDTCKDICEEVEFSKYTDYDYYLYLKKPENNLCNKCYVNALKKHANKIQQLGYRNEDK